MSIISPSVLLPLIGSITRPAQYIGDEFGICKKDWGKIPVKIALAYPDIYEIGMSYLGQKILYHIINTLSYALAERVYAPEADMQKVLKLNNFSIFSLETKKELNDFDLIGFSLCYELNYTTMLNMLALGDIPVLRKERIGKDYPLVCVGGANTFNPEPLKDFIDFFVIGDGEEVIKEIAENLLNNKTKTREQKLESLSKIDGIYVPEFYKKGTKIKRRIIKELQAEYHPLNFPESCIPTVHDRAVIEVRRGCEHGCRFCQAGMVYRPVREQSKENVLNLVQQTLQKFGYEECSLFSLSTSDYTALPDIIPELLTNYSAQGYSFSLPSLRIDNFSLSLANAVQLVRKSTLTFAIEAGSARLRNIINKNINQEEIFNTVSLAIKAGWQKIKLYFIIGLPGETEEDLNEIVQLVKSIQKISNNLVITFSIFVPKSHTPFQWCRLNTVDEIMEKQKFLKQSLRSKSIKMNFHNIYQTRLEALLGLGDSSMGELIYKAWKNGANLDAWDDIFKYSFWQKAINESENIQKQQDSLHKEKDLDMELPWDFIDSGISKEFLQKEYKKAFNEQITLSCTEECSDCGVCPSYNTSLMLANPSDKRDLKSLEINTDTLARPCSTTVSRIRAKFHKTGNAKFLSHLDMLKLFTKVLRRAAIKVSYSAGYNPQPQIQFSPPLPINATSECEYLDLFLTHYYDPNFLKQQLNNFLPLTIQILSVWRLPLSAPSVFDTMKMAIWEVELQFEGDIYKGVQEFLSKSEIIVNREKDGKTKSINIRPYVKNIEVKDIQKHLYDVTVHTLIDRGKTTRLAEIFNSMDKCLKTFTPSKIIFMHRNKLE